MTAASDLTTGQLARLACRRGEWTGPTPALAPGYAQANLVILPARQASDFRRFCELNPRPCPVLTVTGPGRYDLSKLASDADLRTDLPRYRVWRDGQLDDEPTDILGLWQDDFASFLIGCSFTFDTALVRAGLPVRHLEADVNVPMYRTNTPCQPAGVFSGPLVVSMRPFTPAQADSAGEVTRRFPNFHGEPIHVGDPTALGIDDLSAPDFGDAVEVRDDEIPVFWACGVTPQCALTEARLPLAITHAPGHMFITDVPNESLLGSPA